MSQKILHQFSSPYSPLRIHQVTPVRSVSFAFWEYKATGDLLPFFTNFAFPYFTI
jgi:hypothetical protein